MVCSAKRILRQGIGLSDVRSFYGTDSGKSLFGDDDGRVVFVPEKACLYAPWGWLVTPIYFNGVARSEKVENWRHFMQVPCVEASAASHVDIDVMRATRSYLMGHMTTLTASMWVERQAAVEELFTQLGSQWRDAEGL